MVSIICNGRTYTYTVRNTEYYEGEREDISNAPPHLKHRILKLLEQKQSSPVSPDPLDEEYLKSIKPKDLLKAEYEAGIAEGFVWAESANYRALKAAATRLTTDELSRYCDDMEDLNVAMSVDLLCHFEKAEAEVPTAFREKYKSLLEFCAKISPVPTNGDFPNAMFRSYEQGWTQAVREHWEDVAPFLGEHPNYLIID